MARTTKPNAAPAGFRWLLATQFLGSVNDNALKVTVSLLAVHRLLEARGPIDYVSLAGFSFILPGLFFSTYAGFLADRLSKRSVLVATKSLEILVVALVFWALRSEGFAPLLLVLFLMGLQSTLFTPAKYGILPEMFPESRLSRANGSLQMFTFLAIIFGTALGGQLVEWFAVSGEEVRRTARRDRGAAAGAGRVSARRARSRRAQSSGPTLTP
jgi:acyl-[acyl-carrier-protein]-phospholipid O-acyltransferase/long-chain-fatty-acid--[acyl-carrier-protein] ligase